MIRARLAAWLGAALLAASCQVSERTKTTTILGTWMWDVASDRLGREGDFWLQHATPTESYLTPQAGARAAVVTHGPFAKIDAGAARRAALSNQRIAHTQLQPGAIVVFSTREGKLGKLQVVGYKSSHDFDFPEAAQLPASWKNFSKGRPEIPAFHLQVRWTLLE